ncbi:putative enterotoxin [Ophiocordyceps unilateralis]|uniref:Enterotoxin n=1 Tax=Ophiocordyceps unilateralis TaxID=268505 RepID=A0A2A9PAL9_OPHUN|nr:putative enterotoxin [Ophiocordyceps unilateralis]
MHRFVVVTFLLLLRGLAYRRPSGALFKRQVSAKDDSRAVPGSPAPNPKSDRLKDFTTSLSEQGIRVVGPKVEVVFRGDSRTMSQIKQAGGMSSRMVEYMNNNVDIPLKDLESGLSMWDHVHKANFDKTFFVSVSESPAVAKEFATNQGKRSGRIWFIHATENMLSVEKTLGPWVPKNAVGSKDYVRTEFEFATLGPIDLKQIKGYVEVEANKKITPDMMDKWMRGETPAGFKPNPDYDKDLFLGRAARLVSQPVFAGFPKDHKAWNDAQNKRYKDKSRVEAFARFWKSYCGGPRLQKRDGRQSCDIKLLRSAQKGLQLRKERFSTKLATKRLQYTGGSLLLAADQVLHVGRNRLIAGLKRSLKPSLPDFSTGLLKMRQSKMKPKTFLKGSSFLVDIAFSAIEVWEAFTTNTTGLQKAGALAAAAIDLTVPIPGLSCFTSMATHGPNAINFLSCALVTGAMILSPALGLTFLAALMAVQLGGSYEGHHSLSLPYLLEDRDALWRRKIDSLADFILSPNFTQLVEANFAIPTTAILYASAEATAGLYLAAAEADEEIKASRDQMAAEITVQTCERIERERNNTVHRMDLFLNELERNVSRQLGDSYLEFARKRFSDDLAKNGQLLEQFRTSPNLEYRIEVALKNKKDVGRDTLDRLASKPISGNSQYNLADVFSSTKAGNRTWQTVVRGILAQPKFRCDHLMADHQGLMNLVREDCRKYPSPGCIWSDEREPKVIDCHDEGIFTEQSILNNMANGKLACGADANFWYWRMGNLANCVVDDDSDSHLNCTHYGRNLDSMPKPTLDKAVASGLIVNPPPEMATVDCYVEDLTEKKWLLSAISHGDVECGTPQDYWMWQGAWLKRCTNGTCHLHNPEYMSEDIAKGAILNGVVPDRSP